MTCSLRPSAKVTATVQSDIPQTAHCGGALGRFLTFADKRGDSDGADAGRRLVSIFCLLMMGCPTCAVASRLKDGSCKLASAAFASNHITASARHSQKSRATNSQFLSRHRAICAIRAIPRIKDAENSTNSMNSTHALSQITRRFHVEPPSMLLYVLHL